MNNKSIKACAAFAALAFSIPALSSDYTEHDPLMNSVANNKMNIGAKYYSQTKPRNIEWMAQLPPTLGWTMMKLKNGRFMLIDSSMRFAIDGAKLMDNQFKQLIDSPEAANDAWRVSPKELARLLEQLPVFNYGIDKPEADVTILLAARKDKATKDAIDLINKNLDKYRIDVILMADQADKISNAISVNLYCATDRKDAKKRLLDMNFPDVTKADERLEMLPTCDYAAKFAGTLSFSLLNNILQIPFYIKSNGDTLTSSPKDLRAFLEFDESRRADMDVDLNADLDDIIAGSTKND
ncbi:hypothetical protein EIJ81_00565 (plasmid) [Aliivibrio salmonicida]|uniref:hypothetical protein n=1 Tax=Aliivibrio salmonicida TaxID=40269 RepID=UPI000F6F0C94|nr:hypothetical protein [Aliivibrio salmonicida]AZL83392.1 hypothetical protein EIJ81_00565 [Aliivibrio salmonicida]